MTEWDSTLHGQSWPGEVYKLLHAQEETWTKHRHSGTRVEASCMHKTGLRTGIVKHRLKLVSNAIKK